MKIKIVKTRENAVLPYRATKQAGGWDVTAVHIEYKSENEVHVYLGIAMQPINEKVRVIGEPFRGDVNDTTYRIRFSPRSSFTKYNWVLQNSPALGDADYTGEYKLVFKAIPTKINYSEFDVNLTYDKFPYEIGDRVAQLWVEKIIPIHFEEVEKLKETERGSGGFGSTN